MAIASNAVMMPYCFTTLQWTQTPSAAAEDTIFYAVNLYWQIYEAFITYCLVACCPSTLLPCRESQACQAQSACPHVAASLWRSAAWW